LATGVTLIVYAVNLLRFGPRRWALRSLRTLLPRPGEKKLFMVRVYRPGRDDRHNSQTVSTAEQFGCRTNCFRGCAGDPAICFAGRPCCLIWLFDGTSNLGIYSTAFARDCWVQYDQPPIRFLVCPWTGECGPLQVVREQTAGCIGPLNSPVTSCRGGGRKPAHTDARPRCSR